MSFLGSPASAQLSKAAIAVGSSRLYAGKKSFIEKTTLVANTVSAGFPYQSGVAVNGVAYIPSSSGKIYSTVNFRDFTEITMTIPSNESYNTFSSGAHLFKVSGFPNRIYAVAYQITGGQFNDAIGIWYSDNGCVTWTLLSGFVGGISASTQCRGLVVNNAADKIYMSVNNFGTATIALKVIRISDGVEIDALNDGNNQNALMIESDIIYRVTNNTYYVGTGTLAFSAAATQVANFIGYAAALNIINGTQRVCVIGRNSSTGKLQITYNSSVVSGNAWIAATLPDISLGSLAIGYCNIASLGANKGFVAVYADASDATNSGALYSKDGITWGAATEKPAFTSVTNVYINPLRN
jgi:hypothetical protein